ncbi:MAG: hypothetical protein OXT65_10530 [Alphaproteobacteria bacterium]|nr:hypothetical protein [Alphaproteobacteria bacterium]
MSESERRKPEEIVTLRDSVLGEMHQGQMYTETEYTLISTTSSVPLFILTLVPPFWSGAFMPWCGCWSRPNVRFSGR